MRSVLWISLVVLIILASCGSDDPVLLSQTLKGTWDLVAYSDHDVSGATTGSSTFRDDGTFVIVGTVTYPGGPVDSLDVSGTYQVVVMMVTLTTAEGTGAWSMVFSGDRCVLALIGSDPPTSMTLKRQP